MNKLLLLGIAGGLFVGATGTALAMGGYGYGRGGNDMSPMRDRTGAQNMPSNGTRGMGYGIGMNGNGPQGNATRQSITSKNCLADECLSVDNLEYPVGTLSETARTALDSALADEYHAHATYEAVIEKFGSERPFVMIIRAEEQHINALKAVYDRYSLTPPEAGEETVQLEGTLADMCKIGVDAEIANASLYRDELLPAVTDYEDITFVFTNLMNASQEKHLPAFERCAS